MPAARRDPRWGCSRAQSLLTRGKDAVMVRNGLFLTLCAGLFFALTFGAGTVSGEDADSKIRRQLAVQSALQQGRDNLQRGEYQAAVYCLEKEIARVDGNRDYINALREAYRCYIRELQQGHRNADAKTYQERLKILDPGYQVELNTGGSSNPPTIASLAAQSAPPPPTVNKPMANYTARPQMPDEHPDPFADSNSGSTSSNNDLLDRARRDYDAKKYESANRLYEEANRLDGRSTAPYRELWAFCKLYVATEALNKAGWAAPAEAEKEVLAALNLTTSQELQRQSRELLRAIQDRRIEVRHVPGQGQKWAEVETANFRVIYHESRDLAEQAARVAEMTRAAAIRKWFGEESTPWETKCVIFLYPNGDFYARQTGKAKDSPGHSTLARDSTNLERVVKRQIDLHCDVAEMLTHVLPHETTHAVLYGRFGRHEVPRWADEGMAILSEPREKIERYLKLTPSLRSRHELFSASELMSYNDNYPESRRVTAFWVQSVSLVDFLTSQKGGPQAFTRFVREGLESGFEKSLQRHYGFRDFKELEERLSQSSGVALSGR
jgi:tetratricopeptide (TPR) repeat protein